MKIFAGVKKFDRNLTVFAMGLIGLCLCLASSCYADIANDLKPIDGYVVKAVFWDYSDTNRPLFNHLQNTLPALTCQDYTTSQVERPPKPSALVEQSAALIFIVQNNILEVRDSQYGLLRKYPLGEASAMSGAGVSNTSLTVGTQAAYEKNTPRIVNYGPSSAMAQLSDNTLMADLLKQNGERLLAATDGNKIRIFSVIKAEKQLSLLAEGKIDGFGKILTLKWWQSKDDGLLYLAVLAWTDEKIDSTVFRLHNNQLTMVVRGLDTILGSFDLDKDGRPETLLSQNFNADSFFGRSIKEMYWHNSHLKQKDITLELPSKFTVIGGLLADLTGDGELEAVYVRNGSLWVYSWKKRIYVSPRQMGGSLSALTYKIDPTLLDYRSTSVFFEVAPIAVDIDADGRHELLVVSSDQSSIKAPGLMTTIAKSRIVIFNYENGAFVRGTVGEPIDAAIQGLGADGRQILFVATDPGSLLDQGGSSQLEILDVVF